jgi:hypothetical protein
VAPSIGPDAHHPAAEALGIVDVELDRRLVDVEPARGAMIRA